MTPEPPDFLPVVGQTLDQLTTPALLIESRVLDQNLQDMQALATRHGLRLRPHIKTHKSAWLAKRQLAFGAAGLACAKLAEAEIMVAYGLPDLFIANQIVTPDKAIRLAEVNKRADVSVGVDSVAGTDVLANAASRAGVTLEVMIEADCGLGRAGVRTTPEAIQLAEHISKKKSLRLVGLFTHAGQAYAARSTEDLTAIGTLEGRTVVTIAGQMRRAGIECESVSVGSTPTAPFCAAVPGVTELRVGNYVFHDRMQVALGAASVAQCALTILTTVTSRPEPELAIIDAGSKTFTTEQGAHGLSGLTGYGEQLDGPARVVRLSEEHGYVALNGYDTTVGSRMRFIPNHACAVSNLADQAWLVDGLTVLGAVNISARGRVS